ncbi:unnamed protein product [Acidithrix sp. C25]|nr:unnamed protein product [Acidithrix sp. C25]
MLAIYKAILLIVSNHLQWHFFRDNYKLLTASIEVPGFLMKEALYSTWL